MRLMPPVALLSAVLLVACGGLNGKTGVPIPVSPPTGALSAWSTFPAGQTPRPVVLIANLSPGGFGSGDSKIAALCHKFTSEIQLSTMVPRESKAAWLTGTKATYPAISAAAALTAMTQPGPGTSDPQCTTAKPVVFKAVRFGAYAFVTDRGSAQIDSWLFTASAFTGEMAYPALAAPAIWNADLSKGLGNGGATVSADGLSLDFGFTGAPATGACGADYRGVVAESQTAVAVALQETRHSTDANLVCDTMGYARSVVVSLASPLGGRVLLDASGNFGPVCPAANPKCW